MMRKLLTGGEVETGTVADLEGAEPAPPPPPLWATDDAVTVLLIRDNSNIL